MVGWYHQLNGHEFEQAPGDSEGQGSLVWCSPWGPRVRHDLLTEQQHEKPGMDSVSDLNFAYPISLKPWPRRQYRD